MVRKFTTLSTRNRKVSSFPEVLFPVPGSIKETGGLRRWWKEAETPPWAAGGPVGYIYYR